MLENIDVTEKTEKSQNWKKFWFLIFNFFNFGIFLFLNWKIGKIRRI